MALGRTAFAVGIDVDDVAFRGAVGIAGSVAPESSAAKCARAVCSADAFKSDLFSLFEESAF